MEKIQIKTSNRVYTIASNGGYIEAGYYPINKKTGKPWQSRRGLGGDTVKLINTKTGESKLIDAERGEIPSQWNEGGRFNTAFLFFSSFDVARAAVIADLVKRGESIESEIDFD